MGRFFNAEILWSNPIHFRYLKNETIINYVKNEPGFEDCQIYFLCKVKKIRFDITSIKKDIEYIMVTIIVGGIEAKRVKFIPPGIVPSIGFDIDHKLTTPQDLVIIQKGHPTLHLIPETVAEVTDLKNSPEILYIGESANIIHRLQKHEKIVHATTEMDDNHELRVFINSFRYSFIAGAIRPNNSLIFGIRDLNFTKANLNKEDLKEITRLTERVLIHFFQPEYNNEHKKLNIVSDYLIKKILTDQRISGLYMSIDIEGDFFNFYTNTQKLDDKNFYFNFDTPDNGYIKGQPPIELIRSFDNKK